ncbi:hypothetical protein Q8A73_021043 [Channa argus]|nr:hypothetical protein Q8A73_021043 [Channa argus]
MNDSTIALDFHDSQRCCHSAAISQQVTALPSCARTSLIGRRGPPAPQDVSRGKREDASRKREGKVLITVMTFSTTNRCKVYADRSPFLQVEDRMLYPYQSAAPDYLQCLQTGNEDMWDMSQSSTEQTRGKDYQSTVPVAAHVQAQLHKVRATSKRETEERSERRLAQ